MTAFPQRSLGALLVPQQELRIPWVGSDRVKVLLFLSVAVALWNCYKSVKHRINISLVARQPWHWIRRVPSVLSNVMQLAVLNGLLIILQWKTLPAKQWAWKSTADFAMLLIMLGKVLIAAKTAASVMRWKTSTPLTLWESSLSSSVPITGQAHRKPQLRDKALCREAPTGCPNILYEEQMLCHMLTDWIHPFVP